MREDFIHYSARKALRTLGWQLLAGEYPNGSDDELRPMTILDPFVARDASPFPRQHALGKLVPDLVALKEHDLLLIEAKPTFSSSDERKLEDILTNRRLDTMDAINTVLLREGVDFRANELKLIPCLAMQVSKSIPFRPDYAYLLVSSDGSATLRLPVSDFESP